MRSSQYEEFLKDNGLKFTYDPKMPLADIDLERSKKNNARLGEVRIFEETVLNYARTDKKNPNTLPPVVCYLPQGSKLWDLMDGNHRAEAKSRNRRATTEAYKVQVTDQKIIDRVTWTFNTINGLPTDGEDLMAHALEYMSKHQAGATEAAKHFNVSLHELQKKSQKKKMTKILAEGGVTLGKGFPDSTLRSLNQIVTMGEDLFCMAAKAASDTGATFDDVNRLVEDMKGAKSYQARRQVIATFSESERMAERKAETRNGTVRSSAKIKRRDRFLRSLSSLWRLLEDSQYATLTPRPSELEEAKRMARGVISHLMNLLLDPSKPKKEER